MGPENTTVFRAFLGIELENGFVFRDLSMDSASKDWDFSDLPRICDGGSPTYLEVPKQPMFSGPTGNIVAELEDQCVVMQGLSHTIQASLTDSDTLSSPKASCQMLPNSKLVIS